LRDDVISEYLDNQGNVVEWVNIEFLEGFVGGCKDGVVSIFKEGE
jgi:hypothetical protein